MSTMSSEKSLPCSESLRNTIMQRLGESSLQAELTPDDEIYLFSDEFDVGSLEEDQELLSLLSQWVREAGAPHLICSVGWMGTKIDDGSGGYRFRILASGGLEFEQHSWLSGKED